MWTTRWQVWPPQRRRPRLRSPSASARRVLWRRAESLPTQRPQDALFWRQENGPSLRSGSAVPLLMLYATQVTGCSSWHVVNVPTLEAEQEKHPLEVRIGTSGGGIVHLDSAMVARDSIAGRVIEQSGGSESTETVVAAPNRSFAALTRQRAAECHSHTRVAPGKHREDGPAGFWAGSRRICRVGRSCGHRLRQFRLPRILACMAIMPWGATPDVIKTTSKCTRSASLSPRQICLATANRPR